jgi:hypothetical protein
MIYVLFLGWFLFLATAADTCAAHYGVARPLSLDEVWYGAGGLSSLRETDPHDLQIGEQRNVVYAQDKYKKDCPLIVKRVGAHFFLNMMRVNHKTGGWWHKFGHALWADIAQKSYPTDKDIAAYDALQKFKEKFVTNAGYMSDESFCEKYKGSVFGHPASEDVEGWVVFASHEDPLSFEFQKKHIEMFMSVSTAPDFPGSVHIGICRHADYMGERHSKISLKLHQYAYLCLKNKAEAAGLRGPRYIFVRPLPKMLDILLSALPPNTVSVGIKETLGNVGQDFSAALKADSDKANLFIQNQIFLRKHPHKNVFTKPILSMEGASVTIDDALDEEPLPVRAGMQNMMEVLHSEIELFSRSQGKESRRPLLLMVHADQAFAGVAL